MAKQVEAFYAEWEQACCAISPDAPRGGRCGLEGWLIALVDVAHGPPRRRGRRRR